MPPYRPFHRLCGGDGDALPDDGLDYLTLANIHRLVEVYLEERCLIMAVETRLVMAHLRDTAGAGEAAARQRMVRAGRAGGATLVADDPDPRMQAEEPRLRRSASG